MGKLKRQKPKSWCPLSILVLLSSFLIFLAGCADLNRSAATNDPLMGGPALRPTKPATGQPATPMSSLPPLPASPPGSSNAALASIQRPTDSRGDLRIGNTRNSGNDGWAGQAPVGEGNGAVLRRPEVSPEATPVARDPAPSATQAATAPTASTRVMTYEQAQAELNARGVLWQRLEAVGDGEWKFSCSLPNRQNPRLRRTYEARAQDHLAAIRAVLEQIDKDK